MNRAQNPYVNNHYIVGILSSIDSENNILF